MAVGRLQPSSKSLISRNPEVENILKAKEIFNKTIADPTQKEKIRLIEKIERDNLAFAASAHDEGLAEGLEKGAHEKAIETAKNMLSKGLDIKLVSQCTGLTIEEIKELV